MKTTFFLFAVLVLSGCSTTSNTASPSTPATIDELRWVDTLRQLDEKSDGILGAAKFHTSRKELSKFADDASHAHRRRSDEIKKWRALSFATSPQSVALPACAQRGFHVGSKPPYIEIIEALIVHRECALNYTNEALLNVKSTNARHLLEESLRTFTAELEQLRAWSTAWK